MSERVDSDKIEAIVGHERHPFLHYARAVSTEQTVYLLHSESCFRIGDDLRDCLYSMALDRGINVNEWTEDVPLAVRVSADGRLVPRAALDGEEPIDLEGPK